jgi:hypothetical protein
MTRNRNTIVRILVLTYYTTSNVSYQLNYTQNNGLSIKDQNVRKLIRKKA